MVRNLVGSLIVRRHGPRSRRTGWASCWTARDRHAGRADLHAGRPVPGENRLRSQVGTAAGQRASPLALVLTKDLPCTHPHQDLRPDPRRGRRAPPWRPAPTRIGFVFYPPSPRYVTPAQAAALMRGVPPFVTTVACSSTPTLDEVRQAAAWRRLSLLQFHGDETPEQCAAHRGSREPALPAGVPGQTRHDAGRFARIRTSHIAPPAPCFRALLLDTYVDAYGGAGKVFDWSLIPKELAPRVVLSGGLSVHNATDAVVRVRPYAVDISSGVEARQGHQGRPQDRRLRRGGAGRPMPPLHSETHHEGTHTQQRPAQRAACSSHRLRPARRARPLRPVRRRASSPKR